VVSVKDYWGGHATGPQAAVTAAANPAVDDLLNGLTVAADTRGPTMIVVPSACYIDALPKTPEDVPANYQKVVQSMLTQAGQLQDRVAILDLPYALNPSGWGKSDDFSKQVEQMATAVSPSQAYASYGAAYGPALQTSIYGLHDLDYLAVSATPDSIKLMNEILTSQAMTLYTDETKLGDVQGYIDKAFPPTPATEGPSPADVKTLSSNLLNALPAYGQILTAVLKHVNAAPPSGAMAGIWAANDTNRGVWNAPANMGVALASQPKVLITDAQQGGYNVPLDGHSVSVLRAMPSRGVVVWGARTLDGNSNDFRYVQVRRTLIYVEQSIKAAIQPFVFAANDAGTWISVTSMISNFLTNLWQAGGLMGSKPNEAFSVSCGLGSTMSAQDVLNGYMIVAVSLSLIRPAEFIELTFTQTMQGS
jgi:phage tail sheath protein FI